MRVSTNLTLAAALCCALTIATSGCQSSSGAPLQDTTASLQAQIDSLQPGGTLTLESQNYAHNGVILVRVPDITIEGNGATLTATNDETSAIMITADRVRVNNLNLNAATEGRRWSGINQQKIVVNGRQDQLANVTVNGSAAAGVFLDGARDFELKNITVNGTRADGVHVTGGSANGRIDNVRASRTSDDGVAVVSYGNQPPCQHIEITNANVTNTRWGRGISVVGGRDVDVRNFSVANTSAAGVYVATEGAPYFTDSVESVNVQDGSIAGANNDPKVVQGSVLVYAGNPGKSVQNVKLSNVAISATAPGAERNVGIVSDGGSVSAISLNDIHISNSALPPVFADAPGGSYSTTGLTVDGHPVNGG